MSLIGSNWAICEQVRDIVVSKGKTAASTGLCQQAFTSLGLDSMGLMTVDIQFLTALASSNQPVGLKTAATLIGESEDAVEQTIEPFLLARNLIARTISEPGDSRTPPPAPSPRATASATDPDGDSLTYTFYKARLAGFAPYGVNSRMATVITSGLSTVLCQRLRRKTVFCRRGANLLVGAKREFVGMVILGAK